MRGLWRRTKALKALDKFNTDRRAQFREISKMNESRPNGIACPNCGKELMDSSPMTVLTSDPPQKDVHCPACGYRGHRVA